MSSLFAFLHHIAAFTFFAALVAELVLSREAPTLQSGRTLLRMDAVAGVSAAVVLVVGVLRVLYFEKGSAYYLQNGAFIAKMVLFGVVALLSIVPTLEFLSWRKTLRAGQAPAPVATKMAQIRRILHLELALVALLILAAAMMARGVGSFG